MTSRTVCKGAANFFRRLLDMGVSPVDTDRYLKEAVEYSPEWVSCEDYPGISIRLENNMFEILEDKP